VAPLALRVERHELDETHADALLATEARQKLDRIRPTSLAQAARIPGVSPSDLHNLVVETARWRRRVA